jgi:hypothetical protein
MKAISRAMPALGLALLLGVAAQGEPSGAAPLGIPAIARGAPAPLAMPAAGCRPDCQDCDDCTPEIEVAPPAPPPLAYAPPAPPPPPDDPIAREIQRFGPPPIGPCERRQIVTRGRRATPDADACGIRCWYWRLRHGYCGPGCEYYRYRLHEYGRGRPGYAC